jgi:hypothetical protein
MEILKDKITTKLALISLNYSPGSGIIFLLVNASGVGWGAILGQWIDNKRHPLRYESGI